MNENTNSGQGSAYQTASDMIAPVANVANDAAAVVKDNVGLVIVGGVAVGLVAAALLPRSKKKKLVKRSKNIATLVGELSQALALQASKAASEGRDQIAGTSSSIGNAVAENSAAAQKQAGKIASAAADQMNDSGKAIARQLIKLVEKVRS